MAQDLHGPSGLAPNESPARSLPRGDEDARLAELLDVILAVAANDFSRRASIGAGDHVLDGIAAGINMLVEEIGLRKKADEEVRARLLQAERLAAIGTLAAGVAHEINNPAAILLGNFIALNDHVAALRGRILPENQGRLDEIAEIARVGLAGTERIATIVRGLQNFARIEDHEVSELRVDELAEQACVLASTEIAHRAKLVKNLARVQPIRGVRTKLTQVITNLLLNAAQAIDGPMSANEIELSVAEQGSSIQVRVRDTGRGIPHELQARVFEPFFTTKAYGTGSGLGLSISADIARQHGGVLLFASEPGRGTTFELDLPIRNGLVAAAPPAPRAASPRERPRVLFIDDEEQLLRSYKRMLRDYDVVLAVGGQAGIDILESDRAFDAIFCDISMPAVDGTEVWRWLGEHASEIAERVLFCTGGAFTPRGAAFVEEHRHRVLEKPVSRAQLEAAVERLVLECGRACAS